MSFFNSITQNVQVDDNNSTSDNLTTGQTWTGTSGSTLGVVGLQFSLKTDQNCTVYIEQSPDGTNWDVSDEFNYYTASDGDGWTVQAVNSYWRAKVTNVGVATTTYLRAQGVLCPIASPLPRSLTDGGRLSTESTIIDKEVHRHMKVSPTYELYTAERNRLVGKAFVGDYDDTNFWSGTTTGTGTYLLDGELEMTTGTGATSTVKYESVHKARFVAGMVNEFVSVARFGQDPATGFSARMGAYDDNNGVFFIISGTSFGVGTRRSGTDTVVWNGSFNGNLGPTIGGNFQIPNRYDIMYGGTSVEFFVGDKLVHTAYAILDPLTFLADFPVTSEVFSEGGTDGTIHVRGCAIYRIGQLNTTPVYKHFSGSENSILKYGAGKLRRIINNDNTGSVDVYDGLDATGKVIATIDTVKALGVFDFDVDFSDGLYVEDTNAILTIIYE